ncbi:MAG: S8 family serine peptidase [Lewinella sp.]
METVNWSKLDRGLRTLYRNWEEATGSSLYDGKEFRVQSFKEAFILVVEHNGELTEEELSANGFVVTGRLSDKAFQGEVFLKSIHHLSHLDHLTLISYGSAKKKRLGVSHGNIGVQSTTELLVDGKWHYNSVTNAFSGNTGANVVIGIIDTGIDFHHPCFRNTAGTETRIHAIWDQYLTPRSGEQSPVANLLAPGSTTRYGVEYEKATIDNSPTRVRHRDTDGHGTHVAGIAAGNGATSTASPPTRSANIGVAPEARIIAVNLIHDDSSNISYDVMERDAFHYILNKATALFGANTPVVINGSFGSELHPHDGRGWEGNEYIERHLHALFNTSAGRISVFSAGNAAGENGHLELTMPAAPNNQVEIPFTIRDRRSRPRKSVDLNIEMLYPDGVNDVRGWIKLPGLLQFFGGNSPGATSGTALNQIYDGLFGTARHRVLMEHFPYTAQSPYGAITRRNISLIFRPRRRRQNTGDYRLKVEAPAGTKIQLWIDVSEPDYRIVFDRAAILATTGVAIVNTNTIDSPSQSPDVITVAAYDVNVPATIVTPTTPFITSFSSRGPLMSYNANPPIAPKPNVAAPGESVFSANNGALARALSPGGHFVDMSGTSMAAPHITGLIALMLEEDSTLTRVEILTAFQDSLNPPFAALDLHHDPTVDFEESTYTIPAVNPPQAGVDEAGLGRLNYNNVIDQL